MPRVFLSHSSKDKDRYVKFVANDLGIHNVVYDELTFESGMLTIEEIEKGLNITDIFVVFISNNSLEREMVQKELQKAHALFKKEKIECIYPIIIDENITYEDNRIPEWMKKKYNLRYISRPKIAARRIRERMREISWQHNPEFELKQKIFIGRNEQTTKFEERLGDIDEGTPTCIIASGLESIGRRSLIKQCFSRSHIINSSYEPVVINLVKGESIEDFIERLYESGICDERDIKDLMRKNIDEKVEIAVQMTKEFQNVKEILFILDNGCIITNERNIVGWFDSIIKKIENTKRISFAIASSIRVNPLSVFKNPSYFVMDVPELSRPERRFLLKQFSLLNNIELGESDIKFFDYLLQGFPEQIFYLVYLIREQGLPQTKRDTSQIVEYNDNKITKIISDFEKDEEAMKFIYFLSRFDFISLDFIFNIVEENEYYKNLLDALKGRAICEYLGTNKEYIRVNDAIKTFITRSRLQFPREYKEKLEKYLQSFVNNSDYDEFDSSERFSFFKYQLMKEPTLDDSYLIPSHFIKTMIDEYNATNYKIVIKLADRVLQDEEYMEEQAVYHIRYYLCLSLAKLKNPRLLTEVQKIRGLDHDFLLGFYYRLTKQYPKAIERMKKCLESRPYSDKVKTELVLIYQKNYDYNTALEFSREVYYNHKDNPYHAYLYFINIINQERSAGNRKEIIDVLEHLRKVDSIRAKDMYLQANAQFLAYYENNKNSAMIEINKAISLFQSKYAWFTKFELAKDFKSKEDMNTSLQYLEENIDKEESLYEHFIICKAIYMACCDNKDKALELINRELTKYPTDALNKIRKKIQDTVVF